MQSTIEKDVATIQRSAEAMDAAETEVIGTASHYDVVRQGDVYLVCLPTLPAGKVIENRQLAPGTTQGSRHTLHGICTIIDLSDKVAMAGEINAQLRSPNVQPKLIGPAFLCKGLVTVDHPEHGNRALPEGSSWVTVYQRAHADEVRRVSD